jgi:hypothetical protein
LPGVEQRRLVLLVEDDEATRAFVADNLGELLSLSALFTYVQAIRSEGVVAHEAQSPRFEVGSGACFNLVAACAQLSMPSS